MYTADDIDDADPLAVHRRVHEGLPLNAVALQPRLHDATSDTDGRNGGVFGWNQHVVGILFVRQGVPAVQPYQVCQSNRLTKPDLSVLIGGTA